MGLASYERFASVFGTHARARTHTLARHEHFACQQSWNPKCACSLLSALYPPTHPPPHTHTHTHSHLQYQRQNLCGRATFARKQAAKAHPCDLLLWLSGPAFTHKEASPLFFWCRRAHRRPLLNSADSARWIISQIRGMLVEDALKQLEFSSKKAAQFIEKVCRAPATRRHTHTHTHRRRRARHA